MLLESLFGLGVRDAALQWFRSYLTGRTQRVHISGQSSAESILEYGVPQGSVLGPILFIIYSKPIGEYMYVKTQPLKAQFVFSLQYEVL